MSLSTEVIDDLSRLNDLSAAWEELARAGGDGALFRAPGWLLPWYRAFAPALEARLRVVVVRDDGALVGLAPLYERTARLAGIKTREIRLLGDAGPRPPALDMLTASGYEERFAVALAHELIADRTWDVLDLAPLRDPSRARAYLAEKLDGAGRKPEAQEAGTTLALALASAGIPDDALPAPDPRAGAFAPGEIDKGLATLRRLSRLEWALRDEPSPVADTEAMHLLQEVVRGLAPAGRARLGRLDDDHGDAIAAALVLDLSLIHI